MCMSLCTFVSEVLCTRRTFLLADNLCGYLIPHLYVVEHFSPLWMYYVRILNRQIYIKKAVNRSLDSCCYVPFKHFHPSPTSKQVVHIANAILWHFVPIWSLKSFSYQNTSNTEPYGQGFRRLYRLHTQSRLYSPHSPNITSGYINGLRSGQIPFLLYQEVECHELRQSLRIATAIVIQDRHLETTFAPPFLKFV